MIHVIVADEAAPEFRSMRALIGKSHAHRAATVVLARQGLQWWASYFKDVPVREDRVDESVIAKYQRVLMLVEKNQRFFGPAPNGPERAEANQTSANQDGPAPQARDDRPRQHGGPAAAKPVPANAILLHEREHFKLFELRNQLQHELHANPPAPEVTLHQRTQQKSHPITPRSRTASPPSRQAR